MLNVGSNSSESNVPKPDSFEYVFVSKKRDSNQLIIQPQMIVNFYTFLGRPFLSLRILSTLDLEISSMAREIFLMDNP